MPYTYIHIYTYTCICLCVCICIYWHTHFLGTWWKVLLSACLMVLLVFMGKGLMMCIHAFYVCLWFICIIQHLSCAVVPLNLRLLCCWCSSLHKRHTGQQAVLLRSTWRCCLTHSKEPEVQQAVYSCSADVLVPPFWLNLHNLLT